MRITAVLISLLLLSACGGDDPTEPDDPDFGERSVVQVVEAAGGFPSVIPDSTAFATARFDSTDNLACTSYAGSQRIAVSSLTIPAANPAVHHAGAVLRYGSLASLVPLPVTADRAGGALVITLGAGLEATGTVATMDAGAVDAWRRDRLAEFGWVESGEWMLSVMTVHSSEHVALAAGLPYAAMPAADRAQLALRDLTSGRALVRLQRNHHRLSAPYPGSARLAFLPEVRGRDIADQMGPGNPPVWIDAVDHGELVLVLVEAAASPAEVAAAARRTFHAAAHAVAPQDGPLLSDLPDLGVRAVAVGGDAVAIAEAALAGLTPLTTALQANPAAPADLPPISARFVALRNGAGGALAVTASYEFDLCEVYLPNFAQVLFSFRAEDAQTVRLAGDLNSNGEGTFRYEGASEMYMLEHVVELPDLVGRGGVAMPDGRLPILHRNLLGGRPAFEVYELPMPVGMLHSRLRFDGGELIGRDYTLFMVVGFPAFVRLTIVSSSGTVQVRQRNNLNYFLHGDGVTPRSNLLVGWSDEDEMVFTHTGGGNGLTWPREADWYWQVYAFRFGAQAGMTAFRNDEILAQGPAANSLHSFAGATLAPRWLGQDGFAVSSALFAEVVAYATAGSDEAVFSEIARLRARYGI